MSSYLEESFPTHKILHQYSPTHCLIIVQIKELLDYPKICNWEYNRPPDLTRCEEIAKYYYDSKCTLDTMFYMAYITSNKLYKIIDGIHRYTALKHIKTENMKSLDLITPGEFGSNNDAAFIYNQYVVCNIRINPSDYILKELFQNINKSKPVPDLYTQENRQAEKIIVVNEIVSSWQRKYKQHFSNSLNPNSPNTNITNFTNLVSHLYDKYSNKEQLQQILYNENECIKSNPPKKSSVDARSKCMKSGCYLFMIKNDILMKNI